MSSRTSHRMSVARHVYLRTQQRRLRHVKSVVIRNLTLSEVNSELLADPITMETYFTIHPVSCPEKELYRSYPVQKSYNPSWEAVHFNPQDYEKYSAISSFILKLWIRVGSSNELLLALEKTVDLPSLAYLGTLVNKGGSPYPPNSVVVGMFEGYYSYPEVGGVPCPPKITHALEKLLPPQSLLEVNRLEVRDSYMCPSLLQLIGLQEALNTATSEVTQVHNGMESLQSVEEGWFVRRRERELVRMRVAILRNQLIEKEREETEERNQLCKLQDELNTKEHCLSDAKAKLVQDKEKYRVDYEEYCKKREMLIRARRNQLLRQKNMISEAAYTFFITELSKEKFTICNVLLQNSDQLDQPSSVEQPGVALGYVAHLVHHLAQILLIPLQYEIRPNGSRSYICDYISDEAIIDDIREFPLFLKGVERALFHYAVHLLNKDIAQIRQHCGYGMSKSMLKKTLPNLKLLLDKIISELSTQSDTPSKDSLFQSSPPTTPTHNSLSTVTSMAVPTGGPRKARERQEMTFSPPTSLTPQISLNESDVYSSSLSSVCFQPAEDGSGSRPVSPSQPSQDSASVESTEHVFHKLEQNNSTQTSLSAVQQYPTMQSNLTERHYPMNPNRNSSSIPVQTTASSEADPITHPVEEQSFVHADLHRFQHLKQAELEEMASVGMHTIDERSTAMAHSQAHVNISSKKTVRNEFVAGTGDSKSSLQLSPPTLGWQGNTSQNTANHQHRAKSRTRQSEEQVCANTISDHQNSNKSFSEQLYHSPSPQVRAAESASEPTVDTVYHPPLLDTRYKGTVIATPHKITSSEQDTQVQHKPFKTKVSGFEKTINNKSDGHADLLEHFIDDV